MQLGKGTFPSVWDCLEALMMDDYAVHYDRKTGEIHAKPIDQLKPGDRLINTKTGEITRGKVTQGS